MGHWDSLAGKGGSTEIQPLKTKKFQLEARTKEGLWKSLTGKMKYRY
jgi:hypothetical protein